MDFNTPLTNRQKAIETVGGNPELLEMLGEIYKEDAPMIILQLERAVEMNDAITVRAAVHRLKGMSATFYATELVELLQKCEWTASRGELELTRKSLDAIRSAVETVLAEI